MSGRPVIWRRVILAILLVVTLLSQRIYLTLPIGQSRPAILELLPIGMAILAALVTIRARGRNLLLFARRDFLLSASKRRAIALDEVVADGDAIAIRVGCLDD